MRKCLWGLLIALALPFLAGQPAAAENLIPIDSLDGFAQALADAEAGDVLQLTADISGPGPQVTENFPGEDLVPTQAFPITRNITIDLNGHTLDLAFSNDQENLTALFAVSDQASLVIQNGNLKVSGTPDKLNEIAIYNLGRLTLDKVLMECKDMQVGVYVRSGAVNNMTESSLTMDTAFGALILQCGGTYDQARVSVTSGAGVRIGGYDYFKNPLTIKDLTIDAGPALTREDYEASSPLAKVFTPDHRVTLNANPWIPGEELELYGLVKIMDKPTDPDFLGNYLLSAFTIDQKEVRTMVKGVVTLEEMDVAPYLHKSRTMLPVRFVGQSLGMDVAYDESTQDIVLKDSHRTITLNLNSDMVTTSLSPDPYKLDSQPVLVEGRTMLPVGQVADILGFSRTDLNHPGGYLGWDDQNQRVTLMIPAELKAD